MNNTKRQLKRYKKDDGTIPYNNKQYVLKCFNSKEEWTNLLTARKIAHESGKKLIAYLINGSILLNDYLDPKYPADSYMIEYTDNSFELIMEDVDIITWKSFKQIIKQLNQDVDIKTNFDVQQKTICQCGCKESICQFEISNCPHTEAPIEIVADKSIVGISIQNMIKKMNEETGIQYRFISCVRKTNSKDGLIQENDCILLLAHYYYYQHHQTHLRRREERALGPGCGDKHYRRRELPLEYGPYGHKYTFQIKRYSDESIISEFNLQFAPNGFMYIDISYFNTNHLKNICEREAKELKVSIKNVSDLFNTIFNGRFKLENNMLIIPGSYEDLANLKTFCKHFH